jgi:hypothetical protein
MQAQVLGTVDVDSVGVFLFVVNALVVAVLFALLLRRIVTAGLRKLLEGSEKDTSKSALKHCKEPLLVNGFAVDPRL